MHPRATIPQHGSGTSWRRLSIIDKEQVPYSFHVQVIYKYRTKVEVEMSPRDLNEGEVLRRKERGGGGVSGVTKKRVREGSPQGVSHLFSV